MSQPILIDGHNDFPIWIRAYCGNRIYGPDFQTDSFLETRGQYPSQCDFPRLRQGGLSAQFWSVWMPCPPLEDEGDFRDETLHETVHATFQQIDLVKRLIARFPEHLVQAKTAQDIRDQQKHPNGSAPPPISSLIGVEGLHQIGNSASILRMYYELGVRYITLSHTGHNVYCDSEKPKPVHGGLSEKGKAIIKEMNRIGMMVDLSHVSHDTMRDTLALTKAPVIFSHSNAYALCSHTRNVPDDVLHLLKKNNGVIMVVFLAAFVNNKESEASLSDVADHVEYIGKMIGYEHLGIGSDFDGMETPAKGLEDVSKYPALTEELQKRGITGETLNGILGQNVLRVMEDVEKVAAQMQRDGVLPLEDEVRMLEE